MPWRLDAKVQASMDQDAGNGCEHIRVSQQHSFFQPSVVTKIMRHDTRKRELKCGLQSPELRCGLGVHQHHGCLPRAPILCRLHMNGRVGILEQAVVRRDEIAIAFRRGDTRAEAAPLCREPGSTPR